jgi:hypothetical protein
MPLHALVLGAWLMLVPAAQAEDAGVARPVDLVGVWHVLVHYTDDNSIHPEQVRWQDRVWKFERKQSKLVWTEYPIVVFGDETDRFERLGTNRAARVLGGWLPNEAQLANIRIGLRTNTRGMKSKKLRGSDADGWTTTSRRRTASASVISYQEIWSVSYSAGLPQFVQHDVMGSVRAETLEGVTRFDTREREAGGVFSGVYERDGTRHGTFWLRRTGGALRLEEKDSNQQFRELLREQGVLPDSVEGEGKAE